MGSAWFSRAITSHPGDIPMRLSRSRSSHRALTLQVALDYTLAAESQATGSTRNVRVGTQNKQLTLAITQDLWTERNREWTSRVTFSVPKGESVVSVINDGTAAWSNWADLFAVGLTSSDGTFSVVGINVDPGPSPI